MGPGTDPHELRQATRPEYEVGDDAIAVVDLFAGCGGLSLGIAQAAATAGMAIDIRLAVDLDASATAVFSENFPKASVRTGSVDDVINGKLGGRLTALERRTRQAVGDLHMLVGGPPCQGHSDLNNYTRRDDPKNALYARMARATEVLTPDFVLIENVPTVRHDISDVVGTTRAHLEAKRYVVAEATVPLHALGVPQERRRHVMLASRIKAVHPAKILASISTGTPDSSRNVRWAIGDLQQIQNGSGYDSPPVASDENIRRMQYLIDNNIYDLPNPERPPCHRDSHSYKSMYGRLSWSLPAQTITSGFGSIGQGRYMHPELTRALTAHEAARLQGFPDYFDFSLVRRRTDRAVMIGNAVPPALSREVANMILPYID